MAPNKLATPRSSQATQLPHAAERTAALSELRADMSALHQQNLELHQAIVDLETRLRADTTGIETQLRSEMADMESRLRAEIADFRAGFNEFRSEMNATLLEHTAQLARLETALGLKPS